MVGIISVTYLIEALGRTGSDKGVTRAVADYLNSDRIDDLCSEIGRENLPILLDIFLGELNGYQAVLKVENEELERKLGEISHALKSSAASFGADNLCEVAVEIDAKVKAGEKVSTEEIRECILSSLDNTIQAYNTLLN